MSSITGVSLWLASFCLEKNRLYVKMLFTGSPLFRSISEILHWLQVRRIDSLSAVRTRCHPVRTLICLLFHPSGRRAIPSGRHQASSVRTTCISVWTLHCIEKLLCQLASVRTTQQPVWTTSNDRSASDFLSKSKLWEIDATVWTTWIPVWTRSYIRQESQFKYIPLDDSQLGSDARSTDMEIVYSTSNVRTPAYHGPDARSSDMEIACCWRLTVRTAIPLGLDAQSLIWKLLAVDVRPSGRQCLTVRTRFSNKKDFQRKSQKFWSHSCPSGRPLSTVRTTPVYFTAVAHLNLIL